MVSSAENCASWIKSPPRNPAIRIRKKTFRHCLHLRKSDTTDPKKKLHIQGLLQFNRAFEQLHSGALRQQSKHLTKQDVKVRHRRPSGRPEAYVQFFRPQVNNINEVQFTCCQTVPAGLSRLLYKKSVSAVIYNMSAVGHKKSALPVAGVMTAVRIHQTALPVRNKMISFWGIKAVITER